MLPRLAAPNGRASRVFLCALKGRRKPTIGRFAGGRGAQTQQCIAERGSRRAFGKRTFEQIQGTNHLWYFPLGARADRADPVGCAWGRRTWPSTIACPGQFATAIGQLTINNFNGGWNYGNTIVLAGVLRPHAQPTGLALSALAPEREIRAKVIRSLNLLERTLSERTTTSSLCYALLGLTAYGLRPESANRWLSSAFQLARMHNSPYHLAPLALATSKMDFYGPRE